MRNLTGMVVVAAFSLGAAGIAQAQGTSPQSETQAPAAKQSAPTIKAVQVVDLKELTPPVRSQVDAAIARTSAEDMQKLRKSIDAVPEMASALKAKGLNSSQIVAINIDDKGMLTLFAKTA